MAFALIALGAFAIATTLLPLSRSDVWWIRINDFPRLQIAALAAAALLACLLLDAFKGTGAGQLFITVLVLCLLYQGYRVFRYTPLARKQVQWSASSLTQAWWTRRKCA